MLKDVKIFMIEDEEDQRVLTVLQIEGAGYKVVLEAWCKEEALRKIEAARRLGVTIAVVDGNLGSGPDDGPEIAKALKEAIPGIKIISFSGNLVEWGDINPRKTAGVNIGEVITEFLKKEGTMSTEKALKEGMEISEEELIACGCRFGSTFAFDSKIFERGGKFIHWNKDTHVIWRILPD